jgi:peptidyl-prolyl cis-trans isomerase C
MKLHPILLGLAGVLAVSVSYAQEATAANGKFATVNGVVIPQARFDYLLKQSAAQGQPDTPELQKSLRENLIAQEIISQDAAKKGMDKSGDITVQMDLARQQVLVRAYIQDHLKAHPITNDALKAEYDKVKAQLGDKEYKARHILVEKQEEAKDIVAKLKKGEKFDKLAEKSKDPGSKGNGGDLGWNAPGGFVKPFSDALTKLQKGKFTTEPVQTQFGWHVIQLDDVRDMKAPDFEQVKMNLQQRLQQQQIEKMVSDLKAKAKVE